MIARTLLPNTFSALRLIAIGVVVFTLLCSNAQAQASLNTSELGTLGDSVRRPEIGKADATEFFQSQKLVQCCEAINEGDTDKLKSLLRDKVDLNATGLGGTTLLHWALAKNQFEAFKLLLEHGASPDLALTHSMPGLAGHFIEGDSVLMTAVSFGMSRLKFFFEALPYTKQPNQQRINGQSLLINYVSHVTDVDTEGVEKILKVKTDINLRDNLGMTACHHAIQWQHTEVCKLLLDRGADWTIKTRKGKTLADLTEWELKSERKSPTSAKLERELIKLLNQIQTLDREKQLQENK
ncbi:MAG: ankyrin repeat domain-containing protein [Pirellulaceae bacterium]